MSDEDEVEDKGTPFFLVRLQLPSPDVIESLPGSLRDRVRTNLECAARLYRSRTLPLAGSNLRMTADYEDIVRLGHELDAAIRRNVDDDAALEALTPPLEEPPNRPRGWISLGRAVGENQGPELRFAADLLGEWWYRYRDQRPNEVEAIEWARDLQAARDRGENGEELLNRKPKPPLPSRRKAG